MYAYHFVTGFGVQKDEKKGIEMLKISVEQGNALSMYYLAKCYRQGLGVAQDHALALQLYEQSLQKDPTSDTHHEIGLIYYHRVARDMTRAIEHFTAAADNGHQGAVLELGMIYLNGDGVPKDLIKARQYLDMAASSGQVKLHDQAIKILEELDSHPTKIVDRGMNTDCPICLDEFDEQERLTLPCKHALCHACAITYFTAHYQRQSYAVITAHPPPLCPLCRAAISDDVVKQCMSNVSARL
jgi:TPR repeat protein